MIQELALDPELLIIWSRDKNYEAFVKAFATDTSRFISEYPITWRVLAKNALSANRKMLTHNEITRFDALFVKLTRRTIPRPSDYNLELGWQHNAEAEHDRVPFDAIIGRENPRGRKEVVVGTSFPDLYVGLPDAPRSVVTPRTPEELAATVAKLLRNCRELVLVDPYFDPGAGQYASSRFRDTLKALLTVVATDRHNREPPSIELHTTVKHYFKRCPPKSWSEVENAARDLQRKSESKEFRAAIPAGLTVRLTIWQTRDGGEDFHNRFVLTDVGGVLFGKGLDSTRHKPKGSEVRRGSDQDVCFPTETDDVCPLSESAVQTHLSQFREESSPFEKVLVPIVIIGSGESHSRLC